MIPLDIVIHSLDNHVGDIVQATYPNLLENMVVPNLISLKKELFWPRLSKLWVEKVNDHVLSLIHGVEKEYLSCDIVCKCDEDVGVDPLWITTEFLNDIKCSGLPNHKLILKLEIPVMLLRNIDVASGLFNGTRLTVFHLGTNVIGAQIVIGSNIGHKVFLHRVNLIPSDANVLVSFQRRQFPLAVCFAMTINKSQGQTLAYVGLYLPRHVFTHGQLYVALSRIKTRERLKIMITFFFFLKKPRRL
jgi:ATP-dependent DNA helicase PIF1